MLLITRMSQYNCLLAASFQLNVYPSVTHTFFLDTKIKNVYMQYYRSFDDTMALTKQYLLLYVRCLNGAYPFGTCTCIDQDACKCGNITHLCVHMERKINWRSANQILIFRCLLIQ